MVCTVHKSLETIKVFIFINKNSVTLDIKIYKGSQKRKKEKSSRHAYLRSCTFVVYVGVRWCEPVWPSGKAVGW